LVPAPAPVLAWSSGSNNLAIGSGILALLGLPMVAYGVYENLPSRQGKERFLNGEFYAGGYLGAAFTPDQDLRYSDGISLNNGVTRPTAQGSATLFRNQFNTSLVGGIKFGYFFHTVPYLGLEAESSYNNSFVNRQHLSASRPIQGYSVVTVPQGSWVNWTNAIHIVGRYGFLKDKEVPFGRLQPYVGIGPAFVALYEDLDSAKNFAVDAMAGVRYMITKHISTFIEYKFNYQWDVEIESHAFYLPNGTVGQAPAYLDFASQKVVFGLAYHW
jgi:opacity protein-like surface antigen